MKQLFCSRLFVGLLVFLLVFAQPLFVYAAIVTNSNAFAVNPDYLIGSASNADPYGIATMELTDEDYVIAPFSSVGTTVNTIGSDSLKVHAMLFFDNAPAVGEWRVFDAVKMSDNRYKVNLSVPDNAVIGRFLIRLYKKDLPSSGSYNFSFDYYSDISYSVHDLYLYSLKSYDNANSVSSTLEPHYISESGDIYVSPYSVNVTSCNYLDIVVLLRNSENIKNLGGSFAINFNPVSPGDNPSFAGVGSSESDYEAGVSGSLSDISSSIGDMSSSMDSASESLEYISTSQNLIIQGIDNVIMHISDQLYAFWDQLYNLIHEPTYARLEQILLALKAIANNSDISAVVDTIEETTQQQIANDNANTGKVESAVEKHGNFIIEGLKSLFIPSDEYFKSYFDDLYGYFSDRFGFLSFPIDLLVRLIDLFVNAADKDCILTLPDFEISGQPLISEASFNLTEFLERDFAILLSSIRLVTSIGLIIAFVHLCQDKWNEVMSN